MPDKSVSPPPKKSNQDGLIGWFVNNHVAANILMLLFVVGGIISVMNMRTETFPAIDPNLITVTVVYPGATPYEVAESITNRVEEGLIGIEGVDRISSTATEGVGIISIELEDFANSDDVYNEVETTVNGLTDFPPEDAESPIVTRQKVTPNVLTLAIHGKVDEKPLKHWAEIIEEEIRQLQGVALTSLRGIRDYQISINLSEESLRQYNLSLSRISRLINEYTRDIPAGTVESDQGDILFRVQERRYTGDDFKSMPVRTTEDGSVLRLGDIAQINDGFEDINLISRFNGQRAAFIDISRSESEDTLAVANAVKDYLSTVNLPSGIELTLQQDETTVLNDRISLMLRNGIIGFMLVFVILLLFLDLKLAFWTSAAIPISFLGGLMFLHFLGYSLNMVTLFALIVVLGIVVDDGIVTGESIFEAQEKQGDNPDAVIDGVKNVIAPVTIGVMTTMAAFAPLIFSTGTLGQIIRVIPVVVIAILFVSLIEAYFILPAHLSHSNRWSAGILAGIRDRVANGLQRFVRHVIQPFGRWLITWRYVTIAGFISIAVLTAGLVQSGAVRFIFFPQIESDRITIDIETPVGTPFEVTSDTVDQIEHHIDQFRTEIKSDPASDPFESISINIGKIAASDGGPRAGGQDTTGNNLAQVTIRLVPSDFRRQSASDIEQEIRNRISDLPNINELSFQSSAVGGGADIEFELSHPDDRSLNQASQELQNAMANIEGTVEVTDSFEPGKREFVFELNEKGHAVGLTSTELGQQLRDGYFGAQAQRFQRGSSEIIVYVRYPADERDQLSHLQDVRIRLDDGREVPLIDVADIIEQRGYSSINTVDGRRVVSVTADTNADIVTPNEVISILQSDVLPDLANKYSGLSYSLGGESRDQQEDLQNLANNMLIAVLLIFVLLGSQLRSYIQPFIIMSAIPFGVVGAILGHFALGYDLTFISFFGMVALTGVVVNDSVVLIDYLNKRYLEGGHIVEAAVDAIGRRFRPILLTTLSTSLGLLPMLLETSMQARFLIPMVVSLATGIIFATVVILFMVPCLVVISEDIKAKLRLD
jgi:multidrug efflux pump subunit AcrB